MLINITVTGLDRVNERLGTLGASLHDFSGALSILGRQLIMFYSDTVMNSQGTALGSRWAPLASSTQAYKSVHWPGRGPLVRTGAMQKGFYSETTPSTLFIGNKVPYFVYQQLGTGLGANTSTASKLGALVRSGGSSRGRHLPARPMLGINTRVETMIKAVLTADIKAKIASTNL